MASRGSRPHCSPRRNPLPIDPIEDELARDPGSDRGPHLDSTSLAPSRNPTLGSDLVLALVSAPIPAPLPAPILAPVPAPIPAPGPTNKLFKRFMKAYLKMNQEPRQPPMGRKRTLKAKVPEVYYGKLHMDCYHFCQQCKDYFETTGATGINRTLLQLFSSAETLVCIRPSISVATKVRN